MRTIKEGDEITCVYSNVWLYTDAHRGKQFINDIALMTVIEVHNEVVRVHTPISWEIPYIFIMKESIQDIDGKWFYSWIEEDDDQL